MRSTNAEIDFCIIERERARVVAVQTIDEIVGLNQIKCYTLQEIFEICIKFSFYYRQNKAK